MIGATSARGWLRLVQYALLLAIQVCWLEAWAAALGSWLDRSAGALLSPIGIAVLIVLPAAWTQLAPSWFGASRWPRFAVAVVGLLAAAASGLLAAGFPAIPANWQEVGLRLAQPAAGLRVAAGLMLGLLCWWRGIVFGRELPRLWRVEAEFRVGVGAMAMLLVVVAFAGPAGSPGADVLGISTGLLLATGLIAMPLARIVDEAEQPRHLGGPTPAPSGPWLTTLLGIVGTLLVFAWVVSQLLSFDRIARLLSLLRAPLDALVWLLLNVLLLPVAYLVEWLILLIRSIIPAADDRQLQIQNFRSLIPDPESLSQPEGLPPDLMLLLRLIVLAALAVVVVRLLAKAAARLGNLWHFEDVAELRDLVWTWPGFPALWKWLLARLRRRVAAIVRTLSPIVATSAATEAATVRSVYREFLALGEAIGRGKQAPETPAEYRRRIDLDPELPAEPEVGDITESYERVRYGPPAASELDPGPLAAALVRLRTAWREWLS